jgi:hypothetical protein
MTYVLLIWTVVGFTGSLPTTRSVYDWRPLAETQSYQYNGNHTAKEVCESVAKELGLKQNMYRCVRTK